jgi:hypothetical protein
MRNHPSPAHGEASIIVRQFGGQYSSSHQRRKRSAAAPDDTPDQKHTITSFISVFALPALWFILYM